MPMTVSVQTTTGTSICESSRSVRPDVRFLRRRAQRRPRHAAVVARGWGTPAVVGAEASTGQHQPPRLDRRTTVDPLHRIRRTLRQHYKRKAEHYGFDYPDFYDRDLRRLFPAVPDGTRTMPASRCINRVRREGRRPVAAWTGV